MSVPGGGGGGYGPPPGGGGYGGPPGGGGYGGPPGGGAPGGYGPPPGNPYGGAPPPQNPFGGPGGGGPMSPMGGGGAGNLSAMTERNPVMILVLAFVTCGIYWLIWKFQTTEELRQATGDDSIKPGLDLVLVFVTCGIWAIYTDYRNAKKAFELSQKYNLGRTDQSTIVILLMIFGLHIVAPFILQQEYNALAVAGRGGRSSL